MLSLGCAGQAENQKYGKKAGYPSEISVAVLHIITPLRLLAIVMT